MVIGIGTDIVEVQRISKSIESNDFKVRVFSASEIAYCEGKVNKAEHYAARFSAKEAFLKAIGTGLRGDIALKEIEVINDELGKPSIKLNGKSSDIHSSKNIQAIHLTLSHVKDLAVAMVVVEG